MGKTYDEDKPYLNIEFVKALSNGETDKLIEKDLFSNDQNEAKYFMQNMLNSDIHFCTLITGFRGTGKSTFVDYVFGDYKNALGKKISSEEKNASENKDEPKVIVVKYNATKYTTYEHFLRKIIRELYFAVKEYKGIKHSIVSSIEQLYIATFNDVKELTDYTNNEELKDVVSSERTISADRNIDISTLIILLIALAFNNDLKGKIATIFVCFLGKIVLTISRKDSSLIEKTKLQGKIFSKKVSSLYDEEIAEYKLFDVLSRLQQDEKKVVFVIDELDKLKNDDVIRVTTDLKTLLLSSFCNTVLVAGTNFERVFSEEKSVLDSIGVGFYNHKLYVPIAPLEEIDKIARLMMHENFKLEPDSVFDQYFKIKAIESRCIKRNFINGIIADAKAGGDNEMFLQEDEISEYVDANDYICDYYEALANLGEFISYLLSVDDYMQVEIAIQYAIFYIKYMKHGGVNSNDINRIRIELENTIPDEDLAYVRKMLSKNLRNEVIEYMQLGDSGDSSAGDGGEPDGPDDSNGPKDSDSEAPKELEPDDPKNPKGPEETAEAMEPEETENTRKNKVRDVPPIPAYPRNPRSEERIGREDGLSYGMGELPLLDYQKMGDSLSSREPVMEFVPFPEDDNAIEEKLNNEFGELAYRLNNYGIDLTNTQRNNIRDFYKLVCYFANLIGSNKTYLFKDFLNTVLAKTNIVTMGRSYEYEFLEYNNDPVFSFFIYVCKYRPDSFTIKQFLKSLVGMWYNLITRGQMMPSTIHERENSNWRYFDLFDKVWRNAIDLRYYKSTKYMDQYEYNRNEKFSNVLPKVARDLQIKRIAMVIFVANADLSKKEGFVIHNKDCDGKMFYISLKRYSLFKEAMDDLANYLNGKVNRD